MSPLLRKEIRLILPVWGIALALAIVPVCVAPLEPTWRINESVLWTFAFGMMLLGLAPFGQEFGLGTFSSLLAQPLARRDIWRTKVLVVAVGAFLVFGAFLLAHYARVEVDLREVLQQVVQKQQENSYTHNHFPIYESLSRAQVSAGLWYAAESGLLILLVGLTGGFWTTLLFRQTGAALWFTILIPGAILLGVDGVFQIVSRTAPELVLDSVLLLYSMAGFLWAWRMFARAQDSQWLGETIALLNLQSTKVHDDSPAPRRKAVFRALMRKEFQSHQISLFIAFGLLVLHIGMLIFRHVYILPKNSELRFAVESAPFLWLLLPWLVGCVAIAEERKLGTMESQLCLPAARRWQFTMKFVVVLLLSILLGGVMPCLIEFVGESAGVSSEIVKALSSSGDPAYLANTFEFILGAGLIGIVSLFASSLTRNTLHALGGAVVFGIAWIVLLKWVQSHTNGYEYSLWRGVLIFIIGIPVSMVATVGLSFSNYKTLHAGRNVWLRNISVLAVTLFVTGIATAFIYQRPWELVVSVEPAHGRGQLNGSVHPAISLPGDKAFVLLPDGRLWTATNYHMQELDQYEQISIGGTNLWRKVQMPIPTAGGFIGGSNWVELAADFYVVGLQSDGTLWSIFSRQDRTNKFHIANWLSETPAPRRLGVDQDWKTVIAGEGTFLAIKTNGTLWGWGYNNNVRFTTDSWEYISQPMQIGTNSNWSKLFKSEGAVMAMENDGKLWGWRESGGKSTFQQTGWNGADWSRMSDGSSFQDMIIHQDGTLWIQTFPKSRQMFGFKIPGQPYSSQVQVGTDSDWLQISGERPNLVALKKDGQLLREGPELFASTLGQPSKYSDWLAVHAGWNQSMALAADGTLSLWVNTREWHSLLAPSRRPLWTLNILASSQN